MVDNPYRRLPFADSSGTVVGLLGIVKCLSDVISKLECSQDKSGRATEDDFQQMVSLQGAGGFQATIFTQFLGPLMSQTLDVRLLQLYVICLQERHQQLYHYILQSSKYLH